MKNLIPVLAAFVISSSAHAFVRTNISCNQVQYGAMGSAIAHGVKEIPRCAMRAVWQYLDQSPGAFEVQSLKVTSNYNSWYTNYNDQDILDATRVNDMTYDITGVAKHFQFDQPIAFKGSADVNFERIYKISATGEKVYQYTRCFVADRRESGNKPCNYRVRSIDLQLKNAKVETAIVNGGAWLNMTNAR